ncbi:MAG: hypothetical protein LBM19_00950 [Holosporales bacterium]|jgi:hypothetical protein|nr:hypothetical protein [Holosporales bacterium]
MTILRRLAPKFLYILVAFCSLGLQASDISQQAKDKVREVYPKFLKIVEQGADEKDMTKFFENNFDTAAISKRFCGVMDSRLVNSIVRFLLWRLRTEAIQTVKSYKLSDNITAIEKANSVHVKCSLIGSNDTVEMTAVFTKNQEALGKIKEIVVLSIPLIEGVSAILRSYFENNGIKINQIKEPKERARKCVEAIDDFLTKNKNGR